jgi:hypothetical protein
VFYSFNSEYVSKDCTLNFCSIGWRVLEGFFCSAALAGNRLDAVDAELCADDDLWEMVAGIGMDLF